VATVILHASNQYFVIAEVDIAFWVRIVTEIRRGFTREKIEARVLTCTEPHRKPADRHKPPRLGFVSTWIEKLD
jgi:hypothetical protein